MAQSSACPTGCLLAYGLEDLLLHRVVECTVKAIFDLIGLEVTLVFRI